MAENIYVRNDNGSQMVAQKVQSYFKSKKVIQEFTKPATPEQNAHIESYHSIIERVICQKYEFDNLLEAADTFTRFVKFITSGAYIQELGILAHTIICCKKVPR
ncbi:MAG: DDE-type integrase/transposase/recombinase [Saprospiraceae bacterium]|nr:DDE-type integrase/transposase/recombinase [Saprospiraceae bacterium]